MAPVTVLYLVHGADKYHVQARYSLLTLLHRLALAGRRDLAIRVFTDRPEALPAHPLVHPERLSPGFLRQAAGPHGYVHRIKLVVLRQAAAEAEGPLLYVDCDTRWRTFPAEALAELGSAKIAFMHRFEGLITAQRDPEYHRLLSNPDLRSRLGLPSDGWAMWNAGTVGVPVGQAGVFEHALAIADALLPQTGRPLFVEQLALSLALTQRFSLEPFDDVLDHYWPYSAELPVLLERFFASLPAGLDGAALAAEAAAFVPDLAELERLKRRPAARWRRFKARNRAGFEALMHRLMGGPGGPASP